MADDADFASYLVARWPALVRTLVLLGGTPEEAEAGAREALARCRPEFERVRREGDLDGYVYRRLLEVWQHHVRRTGAGPRAHVGETAVLDPTIAHPERRVALLEELQCALDRLTGDQRRVLVLRYAAELDESQVADVLAVPLPDVRARESEALTAVDADSLAGKYL